MLFATMHAGLYVWDSQLSQLPNAQLQLCSCQSMAVSVFIEQYLATELTLVYVTAGFTVWAHCCSATATEYVLLNCLLNHLI